MLTISTKCSIMGRYYFSTLIVHFEQVFSHWVYSKSTIKTSHWHQCCLSDICNINFEQRSYVTLLPVIRHTHFYSKIITKCLFKVSVLELQKQPSVDFLQNWCLKILQYSQKNTGLQLHETDTPTQMFSCDYCEIFMKSFSIEHFPWLLSEISISTLWVLISCNFTRK